MALVCPTRAGLVSSVAYLVSSNVYCSFNERIEAITLRDAPPQLRCCDVLLPAICFLFTKSMWNHHLGRRN